MAPRGLRPRDIRFVRLFGVDQSICSGLSGGILFLDCFRSMRNWIQFDNVRRRWFWTLNGALTGIGFFYISDSGPPPVYWQSLVYLLPASIEFGTAFGVRNRPWIWIVATPLLYGTIGIWVDRVNSVAGRVMESVSGAVRFPMNIPPEIYETAVFFGVILIMRAAVGSFIASRKTP